MRVSSLLYQLAVDLNDAAPGHEFSTWSRDQLRAYLQEAVQTAFADRPDLFMENRVIKLQPCTLVQDTCDCTKVRRVYGQSTKDGRVFNTLRPTTVNDKLTWRGRTCTRRPSSGQFLLDQYAIDELSSTLWFWPQVPAGVDVYVLVECAVNPDTITDDYDVPAELQAAVMQWALYRAKMMDAENNSAIAQVAVAHKETFWQLLTWHDNATEIGEGVEDDDTRTINRLRSAT